jgi:hypothetical protein
MWVPTWTRRLTKTMSVLLDADPVARKVYEDRARRAAR